MGKVIHINKLRGPKNNVPLEKKVNQAIDNNSQITLIDAQKDAAIGEYKVDFENNALKLLLSPESVYVNKDKKANYSTTITWSIIAGP